MHEVPNTDLKLAIIQEARICLLASSVIKDSADPADALAVLLSGPLSLFHNSLFEPATFSARIKEQYGWSISTDAIEFFIPKFRKLGWLDSRSEFPARGPYYVNLPEPETEGLQGVDTRAALTELGEAFQAFASDLSPISVLPSEPMEAGALLLRYVVDAATPLDLKAGPARNEEDYLCARFAAHVTKEKLPTKDTLASLAAVGFLFRVAEEIGHPSRDRKVQLKVVVDGPVILDFLGTAGNVRAEASRELFGSLRKMGAATVTFSHCVEEAQHILRALLKANPLDRYGPTGEALRKGWVHENALRSLLQGFDIAVRNKGIEILPDTLDFMPQSHQYFDRDHVAALEEIINWHDVDNETALYRDADTTVLAIRRRAFYRTSDLFDSRFVCVTSNEAFAGETRRFLQRISYYNAQQVPPVVTLRELSARVWLEIGNKDNEDRFKIPQSQLLLSCDRALKLNRKVVEKAKAELARVKPDQLPQFELLLEVPRSARAVMDVALNDEKYVSGDTVEQLVEAAIEAAGAEVAAKERDKRRKEKDTFTQKLKSAEELLNAERARSAEHEASITELAREERQREEEMLNGLGDRATARFSTIRLLVRVASGLIVIPPVVLVVLAVARGTSGLTPTIVAIVTFLFALATMMDRPGAWLSKVIQRALAAVARRSLTAVSRQDLANRLVVTWTDGVATCTLEPIWVSPEAIQ